MATRVNEDGSVTVGILEDIKEPVKTPKVTEEPAKEEKPKRRTTAKK